MPDPIEVLAPDVTPKMTAPFTPRISPALTRAVEQLTGESIDDVRRQPIDARRNSIEKKRGPMAFVRMFPFIGRGNVMSDRIISHMTVESMLDEALR